MNNIQLSEDILYNTKCIQSKPICKHILNIKGIEKELHSQEIYLLLSAHNIEIPKHIKEEYDGFIQRIKTLRI
jgi:hypothetical protein